MLIFCPPRKEIILVIQESGELFFEDKLITLENIENIVLQSPKDIPIHVNTDKNTKFESFVEVLDMLKKNQYSNVSIVTKK